MNNIGSLRQWTLESIRSPTVSGIQQRSDLVLVKCNRLTLHATIYGRKLDGLREATPDEVKRMPDHILQQYKKSHLKPWGVYACYWKAFDFYYVYLNDDGSFTLRDGKDTCAQLCRIPVFVTKEVITPCLKQYEAKMANTTKA